VGKGSSYYLIWRRGGLGHSYHQPDGEDEKGSPRLKIGEKKKEGDTNGCTFAKTETEEKGRKLLRDNSWSLVVGKGKSEPLLSFRSPGTKECGLPFRGVMLKHGRRTAAYRCTARKGRGDCNCSFVRHDLQKGE